MSETIPTRLVNRPPRGVPQRVVADICVLGAGISGVTAAITAARLGRRVVIVDGAPALGGQAIGSIIGTLIGLWSHGSDAYRITYGLADELIAELGAEGAIREHRAFTITYQYDEVRFGRWMEQKIEAAGVEALVGAVLTHVEFSDRRVRAIEFATRFGAVRVEANGYVDASGDATLCYEAGLPVRQPEAPVYGTLNFLIEGYDTARIRDIDFREIHKRLAARGAGYGLVRNDGFLIDFPGKGFALANITHIDTPLDPLGMAGMVFEGRRQADAVVRFLKDEYPDVFANARVRAYGNPGLRQTRWIVGRHQLTLAEIRQAERPADAVARCAWWVELHDTKSTVHWESFPEDHVYYIPLGCMLPAGADNVVAAGRCVDADSHALSAIRVMGPCMAMGMAAAHALHLAGTGPVHAVDLPALQARLHDNLERRDRK